MNTVEKTLKKLDVFRKELIDEVGKLPDALSRNDLPQIDLVNKIAGIYSALCHFRDEPHKIEYHEYGRDEGSWKNDISEELESAAEKYAQYKQSGDPVMLDMARQELEHASYYINRAKMSADEKMREKLPEYEAEYERLEKQLKEPHGAEKLPVL